MDKPGAPTRVQSPADYKSAIQQIENLRYAITDVWTDLPKAASAFVPAA